MKSNQYNDNLYGIYFCKNKNYEVYDFCFLKNENGTATIPLGETLFSIIESVDFLRETKNINSSKLDEYFSDKKYNLKRIFLFCKIDISEIERLEKIREFISKCSDNDEMCNIKSLANLVMTIFSIHHRFNKYNDQFKIPDRKIDSVNSIPYSVGENVLDVNKYLQSKYLFYSFSVSAKFETLSELCIISLYEIFQLKAIIKKCKMCNHFFIKKSGNLCNRKLIENDFRGCLKYNEYLYNKNYCSDIIIKEYKKTLARLTSRAERSGSIEDVQNLNDFRNGWKTIKCKATNKDSQKSLQKDFLNQTRWR